MPRIYTESERETIKNNCYGELPDKIAAAIEDFVEFCKLLQKPENHIKVPSGQYVEKPVNVRLVSDMTNEMAQELANLSRFTAWAKVIDETKGEQIVLKQKIKTLPLPPLQKPQKGKQDIESRAIANGHSLCKERVHIEKEILERQERWRRNTNSRRPPPAEEPPRQR